MPEISNAVYAKAVARAWSDDVFRTRLLSDPKKVLAEEGMSIPDWMDVSVSESRTQSSIVFYLPPKPESLSTSSLTDAAFRAATRYEATGSEIAKCKANYSAGESDASKCSPPPKCHDDQGEPYKCSGPPKCGGDQAEAETAKCQAPPKCTQ